MALGCWKIQTLGEKVGINMKICNTDMYKEEYWSVLYRKINYIVEKCIRLNHFEPVWEHENIDYNNSLQGMQDGAY